MQQEEAAAATLIQHQYRAYRERRGTLLQPNVIRERHFPHFHPTTARCNHGSFGAPPAIVLDAQEASQHLLCQHTHHLTHIPLCVDPPT